MTGISELKNNNESFYFIIKQYVYLLKWTHLNMYNQLACLFLTEYSFNIASEKSKSLKYFKLNI